jgi:hypothetical protein
MKVDDEERIAANLSKIMAMICIRKTRLEDLHAGVQPVTLTGDYSDVSVVDGTGQAIPWPQVSHIDDAQMADLMREIVNRLFTFHLRRDDQSFRRRNFYQLAAEISHRGRYYHEYTMSIDVTRDSPR